MIPKFHSGMSAADALDPAMRITNPKEAADYFEAYVSQLVAEHGETRASAERLVRNNLAVWAWDEGEAAFERVRRLWNAKTAMERADELLRRYRP